MAMPKGHKSNLDTLVRAAKAGRLAILECQEKATKRIVPVLVAVGNDGQEYVFTPFAKMFEGNPYEELNPPNPDGGFFED